MTAALLTQVNPAVAVPLGMNVDAAVSDSGAANCHGGDVCVPKIGDTAEVSWTVQVSPLVRSSDDSVVSARAKIAVPDVVKNLKLETIALPHLDRKIVEERASVPVNKANYEVELIPYNGIPDDQQPITPSENTAPASWSAIVYQPEWSGEGLTVESYNPNLGGVSQQSATDFQIIELRSLDFGVSTFKISGEVKVESEDTYLPVHVDILTSATKDGKTITLEELSDNTISTDIALPEYSLTDTEVNASIAELQHPNGRLGNAQCLPTAESERLDLIGTDTTSESPIGLTDKLVDMFKMNPSIFYLLMPFQTSEDGCDQADFHITICDTPDEPTPDKPIEPTPDKPVKPTPDKPVEPTPGTPDNPTPNKPVEPAPAKPQVPQNVSASSQQLPRTGADLSGLAVVSALFAGVGGLALGIRRRAIK